MLSADRNSWDLRALRGLPGGHGDRRSRGCLAGAEQISHNGVDVVHCDIKCVPRCVGTPHSLLSSKRASLFHHYTVRGPFKKYVTFFLTKFDPLPPSVTNCHTWLNPLSEICHRLQPPPPLNCMHLTDFSTVITKPANSC